VPASSPPTQHFAVAFETSSSRSPAEAFTYNGWYDISGSGSSRRSRRRWNRRGKM